ncbi:ATPase, ParA family protein (plasmid) [Calothrix parasitica NIES-267]|uniref:ATPase, ParA family protein n=1 Tax=Calothrix parasitica NIES-267 TaxID=1973488 RepID=A0A1Z4M327_9CYAN|nr:ATPase, ParA family protein [Calothrix parasitica NIES-267]
MAKVITLATHKGGQTKTSTAKNLAVAASEKGNALMIDLDPQYSLTKWVGADVDKTLADFYEGTPIENTITNLRPNLDIIGGSLKMEKISQNMISRNHREYILRRGLTSIQGKYDYIIIDTSPSLGILVQNAIIATDFILIPLSNEAGATEGLLDFVHFAEELIEEKPKFGLVATRVDKRKTIADRAIHADLAAFSLSEYLLNTVIPTDGSVDNSNIAGMLLDEYDKNSAALFAYKSLFQEIEKLI